MDVGAAGGVDGGPRRADSVEGGLEIIPLELYDSARAKIDANLRWLFAKAYGEAHVPADLRDPFYTDQYCVEHIKPPVLTLLLSSELYCRVCVLLLKGDQTASLSSHQSVLQALARHGIYAREPDDTPVTHDDLSSTPIKMSSHIPLIDALMLAWTVEMMSIERVVSSVKRFSTFSASKELPFDVEDAMLFWINKVILKTREISEKELKLKQHLMESPCHQKPDFMHALAHCMLEPVELSRVVRYRRDHLSGRCLPHMPLVEDLMKDICDGAALLTVIHYYCPDFMRLEDICLKEVLSISDSVYNIQLLREFSNEYLDRCLYLRPEDLLYAPPVLKHNVMVFIAELFWWFEVVRPDFVKPRDPQEIKEARASVQAKSSRPLVPISNATKRSFLSTSPSVDSMVSGSAHDTCIRYYLHPEESASTSVTKVSPSHSPSHPLLPLRQRQQKPVQGEETAEFRNRSSSLSRMDGHSPGSRLAWMERRQRQSSPCRSTFSQASSASSRMTSFAERRLHRAVTPDGFYSGCSSQTSTPDGSESAPFPPQAGDRASPSPGARGGVASELIHLRMQLEEKRRAIETQKKKMERLSARQRLKLGKAAFLHVVKKGRGDTLPRPVKQEVLKEKETEKEMAKDDSYVEALKAKAKAKETEPSPDKESRQLAEISAAPPATLEVDNRVSEGEAWEEGGGELDLSECNRSIELLNEAIGSIQQQMMQLSVQQDLLMRQTALSPTQEKPQSPSEPNEPKLRPSVQFVEISTATRRPPKLSSGRTPRTKPAELKLSKGSKVNTGDPRPSPVSRTPRAENEEDGVSKDVGDKANGRSLARSLARNATFRLHDAANRRTDGPESPKAEPPTVEPSQAEPGRERSGSGGSGKENVPVPCEENRTKGQLIEVDLSDLTNPESSAEPEGEQKSGLGFFFKDDQKAADELAKKRAAFLLKQQKKAEEARLRKQQLEAESELKRDEARRKAEEERVRKEEEKARRELIKQEYLRRKQQELLEEQGVAKPRPRHRKPRPKSLHRRESGNATPVGLCAAPSGSSLSLASAATEADSITSGGGSQRGESVESFPMLSRNASRNVERDWDNGSTASSVTSVAEYNGPRLFKEPSAKSNKPIIQNAIAHCCLAGKVNEAQKNAILEEIERCESNHLMILFRDGGCQFRALYAFAPDTEEILKLVGTGPRAITRKMIDKLFKYSSDRKQFTVIPAKTVSVSVDAITIHNHLWQVKRPGSSKRK
ncbi:calmodulin-regulated spectrin-associated protein 1a isoform X5 [Pygocentrus nattereri]|uniref:calmodulin-regulated spectrin-associated protein 1a isoform X5 n=1 Tax=Pygocentrus nattereri TaxID=42514 RepID=UPI0018918BEE|nr:calmodulin-regulated spectrin-associated protein 1a isoform X5 [Pygocentrus nattereri]